MKKQHILLVMSLLVMIMGGCAAGSFNSGASSENDMLQAAFSRTSRTVRIPPNEHKMFGTELRLANLIEMAHNLTNKILQSSVFSKAKHKPRIVVSEILQNTHDENLRMQDIHDRIIEVLFDSEQVRVMDISSVNFDYVMKMEITDMIVRSGRKKIVDYTMKVKLYDLYGELKGTWSDDITFYQE